MTEVMGKPFTGAESRKTTAPLQCARAGLNLRIASGQGWFIHPGDEEAAAIVAELGRVMRLQPAGLVCRPGENWRGLCVVTSDELDASDLSGAEAGDAVVCRVDAPTDRNSKVLQMRRIASRIAREVLVRGGLLLHGALVEYAGNGCILAGPGGVGKSTASRRLPLPWRPLCDDMTLVVPDRTGCFWAHPWPTWSSFDDNGPGGSWAVENAAPLRAVFFIGQSLNDRLEPLNVTEATALTLSSEVELVREVRFELNDVNAAQRLTGEALCAARGLASAVPAYSLKVSLTGRFWEAIERVLPKTGDEGRGTRDGGRGSGRKPSAESRQPSEGARRRVVHGGWRGLATVRFRRLGRRIRSGAGRLSHKLYDVLAALGPFDRLLPRSLRPRLVRFGTPYQVFMKLLVGGHEVGRCDRRFEKWDIRWPFRLFVDERTLRQAVLSLFSRSEARQ